MHWWRRPLQHPVRRWLKARNCVRMARRHDSLLPDEYQLELTEVLSQDQLHWNDRERNASDKADHERDDFDC